MIKINPHYSKLQGSYLFSRISQIIQEEKKKQPDIDIIKLGIGDVTFPLSASVIQAFHSGVEEMGSDKGFRGYGPEQGYDFLREAIAVHDYQAHGISIDATEIIVSDGSKCDSANFQEIFDLSTKIAVPDPVYPVYIDSNVMAGRTAGFQDGRYQGVYYLEGNEMNNFIPSVPTQEVDILYLCYPNNPTGQCATHEQLKNFVDYAIANKALILYDAAYCAFIQDTTVPKSIFEIPRAKECAVEFRSFSKTAGFTGTRCAFTVIPEECHIWNEEGDSVKVRDIWLRRHTTKFNGVSYPVQKAAAAIYSEQGKKETQSRIHYYMENAKLIIDTMKKLHLDCYGGENAPYVWVAAKKPSWDMFREILQKTGVVVTPGSGFGKNGEGFIRISAFNEREKVEHAMQCMLHIF